MKFREGKVLQAEQDVLFRFPRRGDAHGCMVYVNGLVAEGARILLRKKATLKQETVWLERTLEQCRTGTCIAVFIENGGAIAGIVSLKRAEPLSAADHVAELAFGIAAPYRRRGLVQKAVELLTALGKKEWGMTLMTSSYVEDNIPSARLHRKLGFRSIGRVPKGARYGDGYRDVILMAKELT